ncbi:low molecular weight phosphotyrosine protein phosphatase-like [Phymastichus coffea]|uniref:low molecular weight phosphotyrosine protein phosphatase-like n=1 Tax=Phymastichus coffea TaxID=108790 RepID=UPI00273ADDE8|nr:low molecular weight phosphotyrosine protein phosphatase-like [Phymastichus coffea]XP_058810853.1 low molecular weight phosphotyrosine protein phosphatase-like [Phymastichus coffea]
MSDKKRVLMICLGNICRSPIAEAVFANVIKEKELQDVWKVESAALIEYHIGKSPDSRARTTLKERGITDYSHKARPIKTEDFHNFDWIFGMDDDNIEELEKKKPEGSKAKIELLGKYDPQEDIIIRDPYYDNGIDGFYKVYEQCDRSVRAFLDKH